MKWKMKGKTTDEKKDERKVETEDRNFNKSNMDDKDDDGTISLLYWTKENKLWKFIKVKVHIVKLF